MILKDKLLFVSLVILSLIFTSAQTQAQFEDDEFLEVEQAYQALVTIDEKQIDVEWNLAPGYYLYQHQFAIKTTKGEESTPLQFEFEQGKVKFDEFFNKDLTVYYDQTRTTSNIPNYPPPYQIKVSSQACADAGLCYPPRDQFFNVDGDGNALEIQQADFVETSSSDSVAGALENVDVETQHSQPFIFYILGAIAGGLILNLMPCVFPVLSLKALSFTSSHMDSHKQHLHGWAYTAGVVLSFVAAALFIIFSRQAGEALGWGFQLQEPGFVAFMAYLFFVMGLSLSGLINFGSNLMGVGQSLTTGHGYGASFFTGVLAALVASPCTAPFMGIALGFALTQPIYISLLVFIALGFGMALPFLLLSYSPTLARYLPKPGAWMDTLKQFLAFPLYATSIWLLWVLGRQISSDGAIVITIGGLLLAFGFWLLNQRSEKPINKFTIRGFAIASFAGALFFATNVENFKNVDRGNWQVYSPENLAELRRQNIPVFIDLTADWCITCKVNERVAINTDDVKQKVEESGIVMMVGDWTNRDPRITELLSQYGRSGVPLYLMFPADGSSPAEVLPQILTQQIVLDAMDKALP